MRYKLLTIGLVLSCVGCNREQPEVSSLAKIRAAVTSGDMARAQELAAEIPRDDSEWGPAQILIADIALQAGDTATALTYLQSIPRDGSIPSVAAAMATAVIEQNSGNISRVIELYEYALEHQPSESKVREQLALLYADTGQRWLADRHLAQLVMEEQFEFKPLVILTDFERRDPDVMRRLLEWEELSPDDPAVNLGLAVEAVANGNLETAKQKVQAAIEADPELGTAQGLLGELLLNEADSDSKLQAWHAALPESVQHDPEIWYVRGLWARQRGESEVAARCLWECARQIPTSHRAVYQLGLAMNEVDPQIGQEISQRAQDIYDMRQSLSEVLNSGGKNETAFETAIKLLIDTGREWEAFSWAALANGMHPDSRWIERLLNRLSAYPQTDAPRLLNAKNVVAQHDLSHLPDHTGLLHEVSAIATTGDGAAATGEVRFVEQAGELGVEFVYHQGRMEGMEGVRMQESTGGGVAVFDFDLDGLPDLFFTQGEDWPAESDVPAPSDAYQDTLFRNCGASFKNVTARSGVPIEGGFGQGCSAGDFNNDGFIDLYVANAGVNQMLINLGDGTYYDATEELHLTANAWTTSCLIADLNADGFPDLFDVNYVEGEQVFRVVCDEYNCTPEQYQSSIDHVYLSRGDGNLRRFNLLDVETGSEGGAGLAVVAFRIPDLPSSTGPSGDSAIASASSLIVPDTDRLCLFVANDHEPNYFLVNSPGEGSDNLLLKDVGFLGGLAVNSQGKANACMGVASGDVNRDGRLDLFVTNYMSEANNLFLQSEGGYFTDAVAGAGLLAAGLPYIGWGTQFIDADNNGWLDIVVTNGHVGDFKKPDVEYDMPTQFFYNRGGAEFSEVPPESLGPFFTEKRLGRSLATLDWNRDGRTDFVISSISSPASLLTNQTADAGNFVALRLHAVSAARDAIGSLVTLVTPTGTVHQQLTAGDGYQVTNERVVRFGLGDETQIDQIIIEWPGGQSQTLTAPPINTVIDVVEGRSHATVWNAGSPSAWETGSSVSEPPAAAMLQ